MDNCPNLFTAGNLNLDADGDGIGDTCDPDLDGDGVPNGSDNSPNVPNPDQLDTDNDGIPDVEDTDADGDGIDDKTSVISVVADIDGDGDLESVYKTLSHVLNGMWEGYADSDDDIDTVKVHLFALDGSMQMADVDGDGEDEVVIKDPGQAPGLQQSYDLRKNDPDSDIDVVVLGGGELGLLVPDAQDIDGDGEMESLVWEPELMPGEQVDADLDSDGDPDVRWQNLQSTGIDNCPAADNPGQENADGDAYGDTCDVDDDNDGRTDIFEAGCGTNPLAAGSVTPERVDGAFAGSDDDGDTLVDEALPGGASTFDCDGDGFAGNDETAIFNSVGGLDQDPCGTDGWPLEIDNGTPPNSANKINIRDLQSFILPVRRMGTSAGNPNYSVRWDIVPGPGGPFGSDINVADLSKMAFDVPTMLGGNVRAFGGPTCPWPP